MAGVQTVRSSDLGLGERGRTRRWEWDAPDRAGAPELLQRFAVDRSPALREQIVRIYLPLARSLAMRYRHGAEPSDDLIQVASFGLVKAVDGFDPSRERPFTAYAVPTILGELRRHFRDNVWNLRLPRALQELAMKIDNAADLLAEELGRPPTPREVGAHLGIGTEDVLEGIEASHARHTYSLDTPIGTGDATPAVELVSSIEPGYDRVEANLASGDAGLDEREWRVLRLRFAGELTQTEIGRMLGVSQMQISRVSRAALRKLLAAVQGEGRPG